MHQNVSQEAVEEEAKVAKKIGFESGRIAKFWLPDDYIVIKEFTKTSTGKIDKKPLRKNL